MAQYLLEEFEGSLDSLELIPSAGGVFEVVVNDQLVYSKRATGRHAERDEVIDAVRRIVSS